MSHKRRIGLSLALLVSLAVFTPFVLQGWRDYRVFRAYREGRCTIVAIGETHTWGGTSRSRVKRRHPELSFRVDAEGQRYFAFGFDNMNGRFSDMSDASEFRVGETYTCWYDPANPERAVLRRQLRPIFYAGAAIPAFMTLVTGSMFVAARRRAKTPAISGTTRGEVLAVRLAPDFTANGRVILGVVLFVCYTAFVGVICWLLRNRIFELWFIPLVLVMGEVGLIKRFATFWSMRAAGDPIVELDEEPVPRGGAFRVFFRQPAAPLDHLRVALVCEKNQKKTRNQTLLARENPRAELMQTFEVDIPANALPSRNDLDAQATWKIVVQQKIGGSSVDVDFVFRVV